MADQVRAMLAALATSDLCLQLAHLAEASPESGSQAAAMFAALGPEAGPAIADALGRADDRMRRALVKLAAAQAPRLDAGAAAGPRRARARSSCATWCRSSGTADPAWNRRWRRWWRTPTSGWRARPAGRWRESGRPRRWRRCPSALTRGGRHHALAEEALWRFPAPAARDEAAASAGRSRLRPAAAGRGPGPARTTSPRATPVRPPTLARPLASLRFHLWRPSLMRLGQDGLGHREADMTTPPATPAMRQGATRDEGLDPIAIVKNVTALVRSTGLYPAGHTVVQQALQALDDTLRSALDRGRGAPRRHWRRRAPRRTGVSPGEHGAPAGRRGLHLARDWTACTWTAASRATSWPRWPPSWPARDAASADPIAPMLEARGVTARLGRPPDSARHPLARPGVARPAAGPARSGLRRIAAHGGGSHRCASPRAGRRAPAPCAICCNCWSPRSRTASRRSARFSR